MTDVIKNLDLDNPSEELKKDEATNSMRDFLTSSKIDHARTNAATLAMAFHEAIGSAIHDYNDMLKDMGVADDGRVKELAEFCCENDMPDELRLIEAVCQMVGQIIARKLDIEVTSDANTEPGFAGLCVGFGPKHDGQKCPDNLVEYDSGSDWAQDALDDEVVS